jgi:hypothetical protein
MRVGIQGQADLRMSEGIHDDAGADSFRQKQGRCCVTKIMETNDRYLGLAAERMERGADGPRINRCSAPSRYMARARRGRVST